MPDRSLDWLPIVCDKVLRGENSSQQLLQLLHGGRSEVAKLKSQRFSVHKNWLHLNLARTQHDSAMRTIDWSDAEIEYLDLAVQYLGRWSAEGQEEDLLFARTRFQMADQAHRQYFKHRLKLEPILDKIASKYLAA